MLRLSLNISRETLRSPEFLFILMGAVVLLTLVSFFFPSKDFIATYTGVAYVLIFVSSALVIIDSKIRPSPGMTLLVILALFVVLTCHLLANAFVVDDQIGEYAEIDYGITVQSVIMFNLLLVLIYALVIVIFEAWITEKKIRIYITAFTLVIIIGVTFFPSVLGTTLKEDRAVTTGITYASLVEEIVVGGNESINFMNTTMDRYVVWEDSFWERTDEIINRTNKMLNETGMSEIMTDLDESNIGVIMEFDTIPGDPVLEFTINIDLLNGSVSGIEKGTDDIYIPLELVPSNSASGFVSRYISYTVNQISMEDMGGWGFGKDGLYDVIFHASYSKFNHFLSNVKSAIQDGEIDADDSKDLVGNILEDHMITIAPTSELYDIEESVSSSSRVQQTFARVHSGE